MRPMSRQSLTSGVLTLAHAGVFVASSWAAWAADVSIPGTRGGDPAHHTQHIQWLIDSAGPQGTIRFLPGMHHISEPLRLKAQQTYIGSAGAVLKTAGARAMFLMSIRDAAFVRVIGLTFEGGGIELSGRNRHITIAGNTFRRILDAEAPFGSETGIFVAGPLDRGVIGDNVFREIGFSAGKTGSKHANAILAYHLNRTIIRGNLIEDIYQGMTLQFEGLPGSGRGIVVSGNRVVNPVRMGIEAQGDGTVGALFEGNYVHVGSVGSEDIGMSIVLNRGHGTIVQGNTLVADVPNSGPCAAMGVEAAGIDTLVTNNTLKGHWCSSIGVYSDAIEFSTVVRNTVCGHRSEHAPIDFYSGQGRSIARENRITPDC